MTQEIYQEAIKFATKKHQHQTVPGTESSYLWHLSNVAMEVMMAHQIKNNFDLNYAIQLALLHDILEDTDAEYLELEDKFGVEVAQGVKALAKYNDLTSKKERMLDSLKRIKEIPKEVSTVKLADRITNLQKPPKCWPKEKIENYWEEAKQINQMLQGKNEYLSKRLEEKITTYESYTR
ncbi:HD domain-containing protein [Psychroflexus sp. ALD_RP9]|uniref:HD domain-containing protein n=1 Tax=Psychroflexus sp. ALD_RP9 TaxID=2777186 RepID=UPI001A8E6FC6|nr:HD domain-containing protein [Psychroflexus sp. ALD_RP9]QSS96908.1 bifunctional (p)ppGpp synthetase/guanosine-3',5'-bis(diphosphate) 3'-pyrophosphohydrolase [Psychroflexus sp. ALD_RP9]